MVGFGGCQSLTEKIVGLIQRVTLSQLGVHEYDLLLTDKRLIVVRTPRPKSETPSFTKEYLRHSSQPINPIAVIVNIATKQDPNERERKMAIYEKRDLDELARARKSIPVLYSSLKGVEFLSGFNGHVIQIRHSSPSGKNERLEIRLNPSVEISVRARFPQEAIEGVKEDGDYAYFTKQTDDEVCRQVEAAKEGYIQSVKHMLLSCLPHDIVLNSTGLV